MMKLFLLWALLLLPVGPAAAQEIKNVTNSSIGTSLWRNSRR